MVILGASFDPPEANKAFAEGERFGFHLLSDLDRAVGAAYEVTRAPDDERAGLPERIAYLIDPDGVVRIAYEVTDVEGFAGRVLRDLEELGGA